jgi:hypothetical protein
MPDDKRMTPEEFAMEWRERAKEWEWVARRLAGKMESTHRHLRRAWNDAGYHVGASGPPLSADEILCRYAGLYQEWGE